MLVRSLLAALGLAISLNVFPQSEPIRIGAFLSVTGPAQTEPQIEVPDDLVGRRDVGEVEISGSITYDAFVADRADVERQAIEELRADPDLVPAGWELDPESLEVTLGTVTAQETGMAVEVTLTGERSPIIERDAILERIIGLSPEAAAAAVADLGEATVELWPAWVGTVPDREWRIELEIVEP